MDDRNDRQGGAGERAAGARRARALRAVLSALAGGGLTAAGLTGPLADAAFGAAAPNRSHAAGNVPLSVSESGAEGAGAATQTSPSQTTTGTTPATTTPPPPQSETKPGPLVVTPEVTPSKAGAPAVAVQRKQQATKAPPPAKSTTPTASKNAAHPAGKPGSAPGQSNVALAPQLVAAQAGVLAAELAGSAASVQALAFYRIPLFLLPIYQAAAAQYGVPWQILAAINEIETDYGNDLSVSTAGAVGWMQFMPATWIQYGVDALNAGYADPYNPVDAIFAAARYLRAAGASSNLRAAILAYNHSAEYVSSVLLRAKLISSYPNPVIATLTGLSAGRLPVTGRRLEWGSLSLHGPVRLSGTRSSSARHAPSPTAAVLQAAGTMVRPPRLVNLTASPNGAAVAVQGGRVVRLGTSRWLGRYVVLRDFHGDVFTYAGLGGIAHRYVSETPAGHALPLRAGSVVAKGTVLGSLRVADHGEDGKLCFAIQPAGDEGTIDPRGILANWMQLDAALHPHGVEGEVSLLNRIASASARTARARRAAHASVLGGNLSVPQWDELIARIAALPVPAVSREPSPAAIADASSNRGAGSAQGSSGG